MDKRITIAIDGPAAAGKSTIARRIAAKLGFVYIDTGAMYRAVALWTRRLGIAPSDMHRVEQLATEAQIEFVPVSNGILLNGEDVTATIRAPEIGEAASKIAQIPAVRRALVARQREMAREVSVVMEGRDIGSVVFPDATVKIFLDAHPPERTVRRARELNLSPEAVSEQMEDRDRRDRHRAEAPLVQAPDAIYVDTTGLTIDEVEAALLKIIRERTSNGKAATH